MPIFISSLKWIWIYYITPSLIETETILKKDATYMFFEITQLSGYII